MVVQRFSQSVLNSGIFKIYVAAGFFSTVIFFVMNSEIFTTMEIIFGIVCVTIFFKGISNIMFSLIVSLFNLENKKEELLFKYNEEEIDSLLSELSINDAIETNEKLKNEVQ